MDDPANADQDDSQKNRPASAIDLISMGVTTALLVVGGMGLGYLAGSTFHSNVPGLFVGLFVGLVCAVGASVRSMRKFL